MSKHGCDFERLGTSKQNDPALTPLATVAEIVVGLVEPVLAGRGEDVEIECIFKSPGFVGHVRRDAQNFAGANDDLLAVDGKFQGTFEDVSKLLIDVMMQRDVAVFFDEDAGEHDLLTVNHFAVDVGIEMFALDLAPGNVFRFGIGAHFAPP